MRWVPAYTASPPPSPATPPFQLAVRARRSLLAIIGGAIGIAAEVLILVSYLLPYVSYDASGSQPSYSYAVFYGCIFGQNATTCSYGPLPWAIATAGLVVLIGLAVAVIVIAATARVAVALASGALMALGIQEFTDWVSYIASKDYSGAHLGIGIALGVFGGLMLFAGGLLACIGVLTQRASSVTAPANSTSS